MDRNDHEARIFARTLSPLKQMEEQAAEAQRLFDRLLEAPAEQRMGDADKAQRVLKAARTMYDRVSDSSRQLAHVTWMEGKVAAFTANLEDAPGLLDTARKAFVQQGRLYDAAFAGLDLAAVLARTGRLESLHFIIHDVVEGFRADVGQVGVLRVLGSVESALLRGRRAELDDVIAAATKRLRRYRRNPLLVFEGMTASMRPASTPLGVSA